MVSIAHLLGGKTNDSLSGAANALSTWGPSQFRRGPPLTSGCSPWLIYGSGPQGGGAHASASHQCSGTADGVRASRRAGERPGGPAAPREVLLLVSALRTGLAGAL